MTEDIKWSRKLDIHPKDTILRPQEEKNVTLPSMITTSNTFEPGMRMNHPVTHPRLQWKTPRQQAPNHLHCTGEVRFSRIPCQRSYQTSE